MSDNILYLVQLRASAIEQSKKDGYTWISPNHVINLLDTIEEQRARVAKLEAALTKIAEGQMVGYEDVQIARAALSETVEA